MKARKNVSMIIMVLISLKSLTYGFMQKSEAKEATMRGVEQEVLTKEYLLRTEEQRKIANENMTRAASAVAEIQRIIQDKEDCLR